MEKQYFIYILASKPQGTLYIGVTSDLKRRVYEHKNDVVDGFTKQYQVHMLVYYEITSSVEEAIKKEKQMKKWNRDWKINKIVSTNPTWRDLYDSLL
jgi:putative endonuclease